MNAESELLARCRRGETAAWNELFDLHYGPAMRFVFQLGADFTQEDAEEICQEAFVSVIRHLDSFKGQSRFQTWLFRIAANKARDYSEKQRSLKRGGGVAPLPLQVEGPDGAPGIDPPGEGPGPDGILMNSEQAAQLRQALERLEAPCREVIELRYFGDLSYEEISRELALNQKTVSSRLSKCLDRLEAMVRSTFSGEISTAFPSNKQG